jgi:L-amino acid N-acyltransferase YncA
MTAVTEIALAARDDIPAILDLQERNLPSRGGTLSVPISREWFEAAISDMPIVVARRDGRLVGYVVSSPLAANAHSPILRAMLQAYPGSPHSYCYGPICVEESERGRGLAGAMFEALQLRLPGREGILFIRRDNRASVIAHRKMGMREVAEFTQADVEYVVLSYVVA